MPTTSNFGWTTPADTDLVKDGAAAIRTLGNGIDTSFLDLKGGTTGQVLSKASNTDLDFTWVAQDDSNAIQNAIVDAKGDLISATAADTPARLAVGTNGQVLTADSTQSTGLAWTTPSSGGLTSLASGNLPTGASTVTLSSIPSGYVALRLYIRGAKCSTAGCLIQIRFNGDTGSNYWSGSSTAAGTGAAAAAFADKWQTNYNQNTETDGAIVFDVLDYASTSVNKLIGNAFCTYNSVGASPTEWNILDRRGLWKSTAAITSLTIYEDGGKNFSAGSYVLYGVK